MCTETWRKFLINYPLEMWTDQNIQNCLRNYSLRCQMNDFISHYLIFIYKFKCQPGSDMKILEQKFSFNFSLSHPLSVGCVLNFTLFKVFERKQKKLLLLFSQNIPKLSHVFHFHNECVLSIYEELLSWLGFVLCNSFFTV